MEKLLAEYVVRYEREHGMARNKRESSKTNMLEILPTKQEVLLLPVRQHTVIT